MSDIYSDPAIPGTHDTAWVNHACVLKGARVTIDAMATVGTEPFSFDRTVSPPKRKVAVGRVVIGNDVEIFAHANVDRGVELTTWIHNGVKIDHYAHVGHDSEIGKDTIICAQAFIGGFVTIGDRCYIGAQASIKNRVTIGDGAVIGMGAVVIRDVPAGATMVGNPARRIK